MNQSVKEHWDKVYSEKEDNKLGWFEEFPAPSADLLKRCGLDKSETIFIVCAGTSSFVEYVIEQKHEKIVVTDISSVALNKLNEKLGTVKSRFVNFIVDDVTESFELSKLSNIALWYDRAVLHFFLEEKQRQSYFSLLRDIVKSNGYVIIAVFSLNGAKKCSGLNIMNYDQNILQKYLGDEFRLVKYFEYEHLTPSGDQRPYIYTLFQRNNF